MNPSNLPFMQAMLSSIPAQVQSPLQGAGGPSNVAGHAIPQQAAFPTFFLQAPQLQTVQSPMSLQPQFGGQSWVLPTFQTMNASQPLLPVPGFQSVTPGAAPNVGPVAPATQSGREDPVRKSDPVGSAPGDEWTLVNALRKAQAEGLTTLQAFGKLDKVNNHTSTAWKDYFLLHLERLGPRVYPHAYAKIPVSLTSRQGHSDSSSTPASTGPGEQKSRHEYTSAGFRAKRGPPAEEYHDGVRIPFLPPGVKPKAPWRDPRDNSHKFTKEEKIFFIQFLRFRLHRGPVPSKEKLYRELAEQVPRHNADSWKRLWDKECKLPNDIYIQARKRAQNDLSNGSHLVESSDDEDSGNEEEEEDVDLQYESPTSRASSSAAKRATKRPRVRKYRVTEVEIQAMARFIVEKRKCDDGWEDLSKGLRWEEFAARPENGKRSLAAWHRISTRRPQDIDAYVREYEAEQMTSAEEENSDPSTRL